MCRSSGRQSAAPPRENLSASGGRSSDSGFEATIRRGEHLRASDADRDATAEALRLHTAAGRLEVDELDERIAHALTARTRADLSALVGDLPAAESRRKAAADDSQAPEWRGYLAVMALLLTIWLVSGAGYFWPIWPLLGWGVGIASHASEAVLGRSVGLGPCGRRRTHGRAA